METIEENVKISQCIEILEEGIDSAEAEAVLGELITSNILSALQNAADSSSFPMNMRLYLFIADLCRKHQLRCGNASSEEMENKAYEIVKNEIVDATAWHHSFDWNKAEFKSDEVRIDLPVRVNFCGSPSDAAPYCLEHGGTMCDASLLLKGELPIKAVVKKLDRPVIILSSMDQGEEIEISDASQIRDCGNPYDKFVLLKAMIVASGIIPYEDDGRSLEEICTVLGGGFSLSTSAKVPKGSGLGTSSIIAAAGIKALNIIFGQDDSNDAIYAQVFLAEQLMNTGGGWQDQVGGLSHGLTFFTSNPGSYQKIFVENIKVSQETKDELNERFALIFSGQRRLARNVLHEEMNQCIRNKKEAIEAVEKIREYCALMKFHLENGDVTTFAGYISKQFELVKLLDKGASNACIEYIFASCEDLIDGKCICGAGGGGFLQVVLKKGVTKAQLAERIDKEFKGCGVEVWDTTILF